ncbi:MAG: hypothetical protein AAF383_01295 [Cyanobacteria bacterium P01_A01_bin.83]
MLRNQLYLIDDLLAPQKMASTGGSNAARGLAKQYGVNRDKVRAGLEVLEPKEFIQFKNQIDGQGADAKNLFKPLFDKSESIIKKVFGNYKTVNGDADAIADIQDTLSFNRKNQNNKKFLDDNQLEDAFTNANNFLDRYKGKVSGAFTNRFGRAAATGNTPSSSNLTPQDYKQALGEIETAEDLLDGNTIVGNIDRLYGIPDKTTVPFRKNPEFAITQNGSTRLAEVKIPDGEIASGRNTFSNSIKNNLGGAIKQIINRDYFDNPTNNAYIRLDFRKSPDAVSKTRDWVFRKVKVRLENDFDVIVGENSLKINKQGIDVVDFVEVFYKDANTGGIQKLEIKVENGIVKLLN